MLFVFKVFTKGGPFTIEAALLLLSLFLTTFSILLQGYVTKNV